MDESEEAERGTYNENILLNVLQWIVYIENIPRAFQLLLDHDCKIFSVHICAHCECCCCLRGKILKEFPLENDNEAEMMEQFPFKLWGRSQIFVVA